MCTYIHIVFTGYISQLEAEISTYFNGKGGMLDPLLFPYLLVSNVNGILGHSSISHSVIFVLASLLAPNL